MDAALKLALLVLVAVPVTIANGYGSIASESGYDRLVRAESGPSQGEPCDIAVEVR
jgi:hypothetical protein